jgi:hypothetical protein
MNFNADSTASRHSQIWSNDTKVSGGTATAFSLSAVGLASGVDTAATNSLIYIFFPDYTNTATWKWANIFSITNDATTTTSFRIRNGLGIYNQTSAISSLKFNSGQPNTLGGTILLYGVN